MNIYITLSKGSQKKIIDKLNRTKKFSSIEKLRDDRLLLTTQKPVYAHNLIILKRYYDLFESYNLVKKSKLYPNTAKNNNKQKSIYHIFFDVDSTLTHTGIRTLDREVKEAFELFKKQKCRLYFCTGRSHRDVKDLIDKYELQHCYGIAEAGGIIIGAGVSSLGYFKFGRRTEPDKLIKWMNKNKIEYKEDESQSNRLSEWVLIKESISLKKLKNAISDSKAKVEFYKTKNTLHITAKGVNKGAAIVYLTSDVLELDSQTYKTIGVGDSELDKKMFEFCDDSYAVGNDVKAKHKLKKSPPKAVLELYNTLFPF